MVASIDLGLCYGAHRSKGYNMKVAMQIIVDQDGWNKGMTMFLCETAAELKDLNFPESLDFDCEFDYIYGNAEYFAAVMVYTDNAEIGDEA